MELISATVYKSTGSHYSCYDQQGRHWTCRVRGKLKIDKTITSTNPIAVGDIVQIMPENPDENIAIIHQIDPRRNYIVRIAPQNRYQRHIVAANIDQAILVATIALPATSLGFIDRFLVTAEAYHVPAVLVFNKADIMDKADINSFEEKSEMYRRIGYQVLLLSTYTGQGMDDLDALLLHKTSLLSGHSGVGKSSLINKLIPDLHLRTAEVSDWSGKGKHTTTFAEMMRLPGGGLIIDTPGVKEFGIIDIPKEEISHYFPEMRDRLGNCKFHNCMHLDEPGCAIKSALHAGDIALERYQGYLSILSSFSAGRYGK